MPVYNPLTVDGARFGVNLGRKADDLRPGEALTADNVEFFQDSISQRKGFRNHCLGTGDAAYKGGAPSQSIYLVGEEWWLDTPYQMRKARFNSATPPATFETEGRRDFFNQRPGFVVIPEGGLSGIRCDVQSGDTDWCLEILLTADAVPVVHSTDISVNDATSPLMKTIVLQKGFSTNGQWAIRLIPDATSTDRFYATLTLYEGGALGDGAGNPLGTDFYYQNGANRAWIEPGKRVWLAWRYADGGSPTIRSYYRIEGQTSSANSTQAVAGTLRTNGVGTGTYPLTAGRRPYQAAGRSGIGAAGAGRYIDEIGLLGSVPEIRFWYGGAAGLGSSLHLPANFGTVTAAPPASTDWYVEREIPQEQLTTDAAVESNSLVQTSDLQLYFQLKPELVGVNADGSTNSGDNHRFVHPRFTRGTAANNKAWLTGSDVTWLSGSGALGAYCLGFLPAGPTGAEYDYADVMRSGKADSYFGQRVFCGGLRIPNGNAYLQRATASSTGYQFPDEFAMRFSCRPDALPSNTGYEMTLTEFCSARQGAGPNQDRYACLAVWRVSLVNTGGANWSFRLRMLDGASAATTLTGTTVVSIGTTYVVEAAVKFDSAGNRVMSIYVNGNRENTSGVVVASKPVMSQASGTDSTAPNTDVADGREQNFPFVIGYSVDTTSAAGPSPWNWRYGCWASGIGIGVQGESRAYWAFHTDDTLKQPNDGIGYRGHNPWVGAIGDVQVWQKSPGESEAREMSTRPPTGEEIQRDGSKLLSDWEFDEGQGTMLFDKGFLKNHFRVNPIPTTLVASGVCDRVNKPPVLAIFQKRQTSTSGQVTQQVYAVTPGVLHKVLLDGSSRRYLKPIGKCQTPEMWEPAATSLRLPTTFQFSGALNVCTGRGASKRIFNDTVSDTGLTPYYGDIGDDQTNLGWRENDRDGTLQPYDLLDAPGASSTVFAEGVKYGWIAVPYDPITGIEGAPGRPIYLTVKSAGAVNGWASVSLNCLPCSPQRQVGRRRIYRTQGNGGEFKFLAEMTADQSIFVDNVLDAKLGDTLDSWKNFPPPLNARIGLAFGARAVYFGCDDRPDTWFYSVEGNTGAVPKEYQDQIASGQSTELTGGFVVADRTFVCTRTSTFALYDTGGDISIDSPNTPPVQIALLRDDIGCISHHGIAQIEGYGTIVPTERGPFLFTMNGYEPLGGTPDDRVMAFWQNLDLANAKNFVAVAHRRKRQWIMWCSLVSDNSGGRNTRAIVFDYGRNAFSFHTNRDVCSTAVVVDETTGQERVLCGTYTGDVFEFDAPDVSLDSDGPTAAPYSGSIVAVKKDPLGSGKYTRLQLVSNGSLSMLGNGLRGMNLFTTNAGTQWHTSPLKILWNDTNWVLVESAAANTSDPTGFEWRLGPIASNWLSGRMNLDSSVAMKRLMREQLTLDQAASAGTLYAGLAYDKQTMQSRTVDTSRNVVPLAGFLGRGIRMQLQFQTDKLLYGGLPNNPWSLPFVELDWMPAGVATQVASS